MPEGWRWWGGWYLAHCFSSACRQAVMWGRFYLVVKGCYPYSDWLNCSVGFAIKLTLDRAQFFQLWFCEGGSCRFFFSSQPPSIFRQMCSDGKGAENRVGFVGMSGFSLALLWLDSIIGYKNADGRFGYEFKTVLTTQLWFWN